MVENTIPGQTEPESTSSINPGFSRFAELVEKEGLRGQELLDAVIERIWKPEHPELTAENALFHAAAMLSWTPFSSK